MSDLEEQVSRLESDHPDLVALLRSTPPALNVDGGGGASGDEVLLARAMTIIGAGKARAVADVAETVHLNPGELRLLLGSVADLRESSGAEIQQIRSEVSGLRDIALTEDNVRVLVAKMVGGVIVAAAALAALVTAIVHMT